MVIKVHEKFIFQLNRPKKCVVVGVLRGGKKNSEKSALKFSLSKMEKW